MTQIDTLSSKGETKTKARNKTFLFNPNKIQDLPTILKDAIDSYTLTQYYFPYTNVSIENGTLSIAAKNENPHHIRIPNSICSVALDFEKEKEEKISFLVKMTVLNDPLTKSIDVIWSLIGETSGKEGPVQNIELNWEGHQDNLKFTAWDGVPKIKKTRYTLCQNNKIFEIDVFKERHDGLILIKTEENENFEAPIWFGEDVSQSKNYNNYRLSLS